MLNANIARHENEVWAPEAIKEAEVYCAAAVKEAETHHAPAIKEAEACQAVHACALEKSNRKSMLELEHEAIAEEGQDCWAFLEACEAVPWACPPKAHRVLKCPLQLLTANVVLAAILGMPATTPQPATAARELMSTASPCTVSETPAPLTGIKWWHCSSNWEVTMLRPEEEEAVGLDITPEEWPCQRKKEGRPLVRLLKESHLEALRKDSELI